LYDLLTSELVLAYSGSVPDTVKITVIADKNTVQQETFVAVHCVQ